jgi:hypothetical protein
LRIAAKMTLHLGLVLALAALAGCTPLRQQLQNYSGGIAGLASADGWAQLPTGRWLLEDGVQVVGLSICPPEDCAAPGMAARLVLSGKEAAVIRAILERPESLAARPLQRTKGDRRPRAARGPSEVTRLAIHGWSGAIYTLQPAKPDGRAAHVVILARAPDAAMLAVAAGRERALEIADRAVRW